MSSAGFFFGDACTFTVPPVSPTDGFMFFVLPCPPLPVDEDINDEDEKRAVRVGLVVRGSKTDQK